MKLHQFCEMMESVAPKELALSFDNVGLLIGPDHDEIKKVLVALDLTVPVAQEAIDGGYDLVLTHHPIFWEPVTSIQPDCFETAAAYRLIRHGIGMYAAHTNLDAAPGGVNDTLASLLGLQDVRPLPPENLGRIGTLPEAMTFGKFAKHCETVLKTGARIVGNANDMVHIVGLIGGAGGGDVAFVAQAGCDAFVTGEMKHHLALDAADAGIVVFECGHFATEEPGIRALAETLQMSVNRLEYNLRVFVSKIPAYSFSQQP